MSLPLKDQTWYGKTFLALLALLMIVAVVARWRLEPIAPADAAAQGFSAARAKQVLATVLGDERPHPIDSVAEAGVRERIVGALDRIGYHADVQDATACREIPVHTCARVRNIVALREGTTAGRAILLSAHYDSVPAGPGASDDGSGVAALLEIARLLKQQPPSKNPVVLLFTDGEEPGLLGARAFMAEHPLASKIAFAINLEARGTSGQSAMFETGDASGWLIDKYAASAKRPLANSLLSTVYKLMPNDTDLSVFKAHGLQGLNFAYGEHVSYYHTPADTVQELDPGSLQQQGDNAYDLVLSLLDTDIPAGASGTRVYTDVLGFFVVRWPTEYSVGIAAVALIGLALGAWRLRRRQAYSAGSVVLGVLCFVVSIFAGGLAAYLLTTLLAMVNGPASAWHVDGLFNRLLLWSVVLLVAFSVQRLFARKSDPIGLAVGVALAWSIVAVALAAILPGPSYLFILPAAAFAVAFPLAALAASRFGDAGYRVLFLVPALVAFVAVFPAIHLIEIMIGFGALPGALATGMLLGLLATFLAPLSVKSQVVHSHRYFRYATAGVATVSAVLSIQASAYTKAQPQALDVMYFQDQDGAATAFAGTPYSPPPPAVLRALGKDAAPKQVLPWTRTRFYAAATPSAELPTAKLTIVDEQRTDDAREVKTRIDADGAAGVLVLVPNSAKLARIKFDGHALDYASGKSQIGDYQAFICRGDSCSGKELTFSLRASSPQKVLVVRVGALPEATKAVAQVRDVSAIAQNDGDQSLVAGESSL